MVKLLWKLVKYRLRLLGLWPSGIARCFVKELQKKHHDIDIIWTGKEHSTGSVNNFRGLDNLDNAFRTIVLSKCTDLIEKQRPEAPLVFCRTEHGLFWLIGLRAFLSNLVIVGDCDFPIAEQMGLSYVNAELRSLPFSDEAFDLVAIPHFLYYAGVSFVPQSKFDPDGDERLLTELNRILRPGGTIVGMAFVKQGRTVLPIGFQRARGLESFHDMLHRCGFQLVEETYFHRSSMTQIGAEDVSCDLPKYTRPGAGFSDRLVFACEKMSSQCVGHPRGPAHRTMISSSPT